MSGQLTASEVLRRIVGGAAGRTFIAEDGGSATFEGVAGELVYVSHVDDVVSFVIEARRTPPAPLHQEGVRANQDIQPAIDRARRYMNWQ